MKGLVDCVGEGVGAGASFFVLEGSTAELSYDNDIPHSRGI